MSIVHIVFGDSAAGTLKQVLRGRGERVLSFADDLSWGPIASMEERVTWFDRECPIPGGWDWVTESHDEFWAKASDQYDARLIWLSDNSPHEMAGYLAYLERLSDRPALVVRPNRHLPPHPTFGPLLGTGSANAEDLAEVLDNAERRPIANDRALAGRWAELRSENALLRVMDGGLLVSAPAEIYDAMLMQEATSDWKKGIRVMGSALGALMDAGVRVNSDFLLVRLAALIQSGRLEAEGDPLGWDADGRRTPAMVRSPA